jgi:hypothetical protein
MSPSIMGPIKRRSSCYQFSFLGAGRHLIEYPGLRKSFRKNFLVSPFNCGYDLFVVAGPGIFLKKSKSFLSVAADSIK